jgi:hypothetical protein
MNNRRHDENLDSLIEAVEEKSGNANSSRRRNNPLRNKALLWIVCATTAALWAWQVWTPAPEENAVRQDLDQLIGEARTSVEAFLKQHGRLPSRLPDDALATLISYRISDDTVQHSPYTLSAQINGITVTWPSGNAGKEK